MYWVHSSILPAVMHNCLALIVYSSKTLSRKSLQLVIYHGVIFKIGAENFIPKVQPLKIKSVKRERKQEPLVILLFENSTLKNPKHGHIKHFIKL